jgi:hypothetical protein
MDRDPAASEGGSYNRFRQKRSGSIFGTAISQARNKFDRDISLHCILSETIPTGYSAKKFAGTEGA